MANTKNGTRATWRDSFVATLDGSVTLEASDSGKVFLCAAATVTLPSATAAGAGWCAKFIYKSGSSTVSGVTLNATGECCDVACDGSNFYAGIGHQA